MQAEIHGGSIVCLLAVFDEGVIEIPAEHRFDEVNDRGGPASGCGVRSGEPVFPTGISR
jgi:hypothetical protein